MESNERRACDDLFACTLCGDCCKGYGGTYLSETDIVAISRFIDMTPGGFIDRYTKDSGGKPLISQGENGYCIFWDNVCTIHPVKPIMCRRWPFIPSVLVDVGNWHAMAASCPGMNTKVPHERIITCVRRTLHSNGHGP